MWAKAHSGYGQCEVWTGAAWVQFPAFLFVTRVTSLGLSLLWNKEKIRTVPKPYSWAPDNEMMHVKDVEQ